MQSVFKHFAKIAFRLAPVVLIPIGLSSPQSFFWSKSKFKQNQMQNRVHISVLESNLPCEDRKDTLQLTSIGGYAAAVYDGHGGWQVSELCSQMLLKSLDDILKRNKESNKYPNVDELITESIRQAFSFVEKTYVESARVAYGLGFGRAARAGSCALVCVVHDNKLYCGNSGDSLGIVVGQGSPMTYTQVNRFLNADNPQQQQRLKSLYPNEDDIFICKKPNNKSCYVKGRLQPTRSIGDLRLKMSQFNNPKNIGRQFEYQPPVKNFTGNYITADPQIKIIPLDKKQKWLILGSDGLWDEMGLQEVAQVCKSTPVQNIGSTLLKKCLEHAAEESKMTVEEIKAKPRGKKRNIHDDITIVVMDLTDQAK